MSIQDKSIQCSDCGTTFNFRGNKSSFNPKALPMNQSVVPHAVGPKKHSVPTTKTTATVPNGECFVPYTPGGEKIRK
jgi:hypothetical protein